MAGGDEETVSSRCSIALLGFGTVGSAVARRLTSGSHDFQLTHVLDRRAHCKRGTLPAPDVVWTTRIEDVLESDAHIVVEAIGGVEPAADWIRAALAAGKSVVTANAVLSRMEATSCSIAEALADARARGFAEADPSADLDGDDAAEKLAIL